MPAKWEPSMLASANDPISSKKEVVKTMRPNNKIVSSDGSVTIEKTYSDEFVLDVPASKKAGGDFYLDQSLLKLVNGSDFINAYRGSKKVMRAFVPSENMDKVLDEAIVFVNTSKQAARIRCATIGWNAADEILKDK